MLQTNLDAHQVRRVVLDIERPGLGPGHFHFSVHQILAPAPDCFVNQTLIGYREMKMKLALVLLCAGFIPMGCSPIRIAIPLAGVDGWMQMLSDSEAKGVPVLAMNW